MCGLIPRGESQWALEKQKYLTAQFEVNMILYFSELISVVKLGEFKSHTVWHREPSLSL